MASWADGGSRLVSLAAPLAGAYAVAGVLTAPFLYFLLTGFSSTTIHPPESFVTDLANVVIPTHLFLAGGAWANGTVQQFSGNDAERGAFLGPAVVLIVVLYAVRTWREPGGRFLLASLATALIASLGAWLRIAGDKIVPMPWGPLEHVRLLDNVLPARLTVYSALAAAVIVALWSAAAGGVWLRAILTGLAVVALIPDAGGNEWATRYALPSFFTSGAYTSCLARDQTVLAVPVTNDGYSMLWQARSGFWFPIAGGYIADLPPASFMTPPAVAAIANNVIVPANRSDYVAQYIRLKHVSAIVVDDRVVAQWRPALDRFATAQDVGGVSIYRVGAAAAVPGCPPRLPSSG